ncbi:hypothetical protein ZOSMA_146G00060 [Zostera marina]|uniref:Uncharacterized protein n=1 Tax=Zostera marina TaxID=29655 RepID=A0A0K9PX01_ZOSMR|nr:hypothetical protein ZOSMA_146G00060 [Zostera marina]
MGIDEGSRFRTKINLNEISHDSAMGLIRRVLDFGVSQDLNWVLSETAKNIDRNFGSGYPGGRMMMRMLSLQARALVPVMTAPRGKKGRSGTR